MGGTQEDRGQGGGQQGGQGQALQVPHHVVHTSSCLYEGKHCQGALQALMLLLLLFLLLMLLLFLPLQPGQLQQSLCEICVVLV